MNKQQIDDNAKCKPNQWVLFISDEKSDQRHAKEICNTCPVRAACLREHFLDQSVVVGGTTWNERREMLSAGSYPKSVGAELDRILHSSGGMYQLQIMGIQADLALKLRWRHAPELAAVSGRVL